MIFTSPRALHLRLTQVVVSQAGQQCLCLISWNPWSFQEIRSCGIFDLKQKRPQILCTLWNPVWREPSSGYSEQLYLCLDIRKPFHCLGIKEIHIATVWACSYSRIFGRFGSDGRIWMLYLRVCIDHIESSPLVAIWLTELNSELCWWFSSACRIGMA